MLYYMHLRTCLISERIISRWSPHCGVVQSYAKIEWHGGNMVIRSRTHKAYWTLWGLYDLEVIKFY